MRIYLVRHGETVWNRENRTQGWSDIELNANGRQHAAALARALKDVPLNAVYASTLSRAIATARAIAGWHGLAVNTDPDLRELNQGTLDGLTMDDLRRDHAAFLKEWAAHPAHLKMPGGESMAEMEDRTWAAIQRIVAAHPEGTVAVVSHNLAIVTILCRLLNLDLNKFRHLRQDVAAMNILEFKAPFGAGIIRLNDISHLSEGKVLAARLAELADTRRFTSSPVSEDDLLRIAAVAKSGGIPVDKYHVLIVGSAERRQRLGAAARTMLADATGDEHRWLTEALASAPAVLAVLRDAGEVTLEARLGAAIQSMRVTAHALGYGTAWLAGSLCSNPAIAAALDVSDDRRLAALIPVGLPADPFITVESVAEDTPWTILG